MFKTITCQFAPSQLVPAQLVRFQLAPDDNLSNAILSQIIKKETCPRFFDILVENNVGIEMKDIFVEQLSLKQNVESLKHVLNQNEFKACMNKMKAAKLQCIFHVELNISVDWLLIM